jgi:SGNH domain (fused to AT3 domains)
VSIIAKKIEPVILDPRINDKISAVSNADVFFDALAPLCDGNQCIFSYAYGFFATKSADFDTLQYTSAQCPPIIGYDAASRPTCAAINREVPTIIERYHISTVIMAANWDRYVSRRKMRFEDS